MNVKIWSQINVQFGQKDQLYKLKTRINKDSNQIIVMISILEVSYNNNCTKNDKMILKIDEIVQKIDQNSKINSIKMQLKNILSFGSDSSQNQSCFPQLSWNQRLLGFAICCILGYVIQFLSFGALISIVTGNPAKFAIIYSFGNVLALAATGFLIGFTKQFKNMVDKQRRITSALFIGGLLGTLFSALVLQSRILVILCLIVQIPAYIWYCATYIPFARDCIKSCMRGCFNKLKK